MVQVALRHGQVGSVSSKRQESGQWRARARVGFQDDEGLTSFQVSRTAPTKKAAEALIPDAAKAELAKREAQTRDPDTPQTMAQLLRAYRDGLDDAGVHHRTRQDYGGSIAALLGEPRKAKHTAKRSRADEPHAVAFKKIAKLAPRDVTQGHIKALLSSIASSPSSGPAAATRVKTILGNAFHMAKDFGLATGDPTKDLPYRKSDADDYRTKPKRDDGLDHDRAPTDEEVAALLLALKDDRIAGRSDGVRTRSKKGDKYGNPQDLYDLIYLLFSTGMRIGEGLALRWSDLNFSDVPVEHRIEEYNTKTRQREWVTKTIPPWHVSVNGTKTRGGEKGVVRDITKSSAGSRVIPLSPSAVETLQARAEALGVPYLARPERPVFSALTDPAKFRGEEAAGKALAFILDKHGFTWHRSHAARKYVATKLHRLGWDDNRIMRYMGWSDVATLHRYLDRKQDLPTDMAMDLELAPGRQRALN